MGLDATVQNAEASRFLFRAALRREFHFTKSELQELSAREARWYMSILEGQQEAHRELKPQGG